MPAPTRKQTASKPGTQFKCPPLSARVSSKKKHHKNSYSSMFQAFQSKAGSPATQRAVRSAVDLLSNINPSIWEFTFDVDGPVFVSSTDNRVNNEFKRIVSNLLPDYSACGWSFLKEDLEKHKADPFQGLYRLRFFHYPVVCAITSGRLLTFSENKHPLILAIGEIDQFLQSPSLKYEFSDEAFFNGAADDVFYVSSILNDLIFFFELSALSDIVDSIKRETTGGSLSAYPCLKRLTAIYIPEILAGLGRGRDMADKRIAVPQNMPAHTRKLITFYRKKVNEDNVKKGEAWVTIARKVYEELDLLCKNRKPPASNFLSDNQRCRLLRKMKEPKKQVVDKLAKSLSVHCSREWKKYLK